MFCVLITHYGNVRHVRLFHNSLSTQISYVFVFVSLKNSTTSTVEIMYLNEQSQVLGDYIMIKDSCLPIIVP